MGDQTTLAARQEFTVTEIDRMGSAIVASGLFGITKKEHVIALMLVAQAQGRHPASVAEEYDIIQNRPALRSRAALARYQIAGGRIEWMERTNEKVSAKFYHPQGGELIVSWDIARSEAMGLAGKDNWKRQPMIMLSWRVVAEGIRMTYPACLSGQYLVEEVQDFGPRERDITPDEPTIMEPQAKAEPDPPPVNDGPDPVPAPAPDSEKISQAQIKLFFARARATGFSDDEIKIAVLARSYDHTADILKRDFDDLLKWASGPRGK
jgi:hypothetical protein